MPGMCCSGGDLYDTVITLAIRLGKGERENLSFSSGESADPSAAGRRRAIADRNPKKV